VDVVVVVDADAASGTSVDMVGYGSFTKREENEN